MKAFVLTVALMIAHSAFAVSISDIAGKWQSSPEGENQVTRAFQFGAQGEFTMRQTMILQGVEYVSIYRGSYVLTNDDIQALATSVEMSAQGESRRVALSPASGVLITVIDCGEESMTLQMGKENLFIHLQRAH
jgi:hypothetical protein